MFGFEEDKGIFGNMVNNIRPPAFGSPVDPQIQRPIRPDPGMQGLGKNKLDKRAMLAMLIAGMGGGQPPMLQPMTFNPYAR
jgi:hypothetical protein